MPYFDFLFFAASLALGWGLSLVSYRLFALRNDWPMGELHRAKPMVPVLLGAFAVVIALLFAAARGGDAGGWWIVVAGLIWAFCWMGFMRIGAQASLVLAPAATVVLCAAWISVRPLPELAGVTPHHDRGHAALASVSGRTLGGNWSNPLATARQQP